MHKSTNKKFLNDLFLQYVRFLPWLILAITLLATFTLWQNSQQNIYTKLQADFKRYVSDVNHRIENRIQANQNILEGLQGLFAASSTVNRKEFYTYISRQGINPNLTGIQAVGFSLIIPKHQKNTHISSIRKEGFTDYTIKPAGERDIYTSIIFVEPLNNINKQAFGYDMYATPTLREAMYKAQDSNQSVLSRKLTLQADSNKKKQTRAYLFLPIYKNGSPINTVANRRANSVGWIYLSLNINILMKDVLGAQNTKIDIHLYDGKTISIPSLLHDFDYRQTLGIKRENPLFQNTTQLNISDHILTTVVTSLPDYDAQLYRGSSLLIAISGCFISILLTLLTWQLVQGREYAIRKAHKMTKDLRVNEKSLIASKYLAESSLSKLNSYISAIDQQALISVTDSKGTILSANTKFCTTSGYSEDELIGQQHNIVNSKTHSKEFFENLHKTISSGEVWRGEICNRAKNGDLYWVDGAISPLKDKNGKISRYVSVRFDITKRKLAAAQISAAKNEAERANAAKSEFLSSMSHELRTPLNAIIGYSQLLTLSPEAMSKDQLSSVDEIHHAGHHLLELINEVLDLSSIESGKVKLNIQALALSNIINECQLLISPLAEKKNIQIDYADFDNYFLTADPLRIKQILINLLSNAIKYNKPNGKVNLQYTILDSKQLRVSVTDTGHGLDEEQVSNLFIPFERVGAENSDIEGSGVGLVICKKLIEMMGGSIGVTSNKDSGSTFWFDIKALNKNEYTENTENSGVPPIESTENFNHKQTILYIEDNQANLDLVKRIISNKTDYNLITEKDPLMALTQIKNHMPDLILLDINLPTMDGFTILEEIKSSPELTKIPVIAVTAKAMFDDIQKGKDHGFDEYITKPIDIVKFLNTIITILNKKELSLEMNKI